MSPLGSGGPSALAEWAALVRGAGGAHGEGNCSPWVCAWLSLWHLCKTDEAWLSPQGAVTPKGGTGMSTVHMWPQARENVLTYSSSVEDTVPSSREGASLRCFQVALGVAEHLGHPRGTLGMRPRWWGRRGWTGYGPQAQPWGLAGVQERRLSPGLPVATCPSGAGGGQLSLQVLGCPERQEVVPEGEGTGPAPDEGWGDWDRGPGQPCLSGPHWWVPPEGLFVFASSPSLPFSVRSDDSRALKGVGNTAQTSREIPAVPQHPPLSVSPSGRVWFLLR